MRVAYKGLKPGNFNDATQVVAIGRFHGGTLEAEKLLVKCPSKYQGIEEKGSKHQLLVMSATRARREPPGGE